MRLGALIEVPNAYSRFARLQDGSGVGYTVEPGHIPDDAEIGDELAYKVELWGNDSGLAFELKEED